MTTDPDPGAAGALRLYGVRGWGSAIAEILLVLADEPYAFVDVAGFDRPGPARDALSAVNPMAQVPALALPDGAVLTESAAIALWLAGRRPALAPAPGSPAHARFLRLLVWLVAAVYPTFTYGDYPERWAPSAPDELVAATDRRREELYRWLEIQLEGPFALGEAPTAIDAYLAVLVRWRPRRAWFAANAPKILAAARRLGADPRLRTVFAANGLD